MIDRLARTIWVARRGVKVDPETRWAMLYDVEREPYLREAKAVIEALRLDDLVETARAACGLLIIGSQNKSIMAAARLDKALSRLEAK